MNILILLCLCMSVTALILGIISLSGKQTKVTKQIIVDDKQFKVEHGVIFAKGFSNEPFRTNNQVSALNASQLISQKLTDGLSVIEHGNINAAHELSCEHFTDGRLVIADGNMTTNGAITSDFLHVTRSISVPAQYYATIYVLDMKPVDFANMQEWKHIGATTKKTQLFFGLDKLNHGVTIHDGNKIQFHQTGRWFYQFSFIVNANDNISIGASLAKDAPKLADGYGINHNKQACAIHGSGMILVHDIDDLYRLWFQHLQSVADYTMNIQDGHVTCQYLGR